jgi:hypothetical protein
VLTVFLDVGVREFTALVLRGGAYRVPCGVAAGEGISGGVGTSGRSPSKKYCAGAAGMYPGD